MKPIANVARLVTGLSFINNLVVMVLCYFAKDERMIA